MADFKPVKPKDLDSELKQKVEATDYEWNEGKAVKTFFGQWREEIAWFYGDQYSLYNSASATLENVAPWVDREIKNVYNRILPYVRQLWGELKYPHSFYVEPNSADSEDIKAAKLGSQVIESTSEKGKFNFKINRAKLWGIIVGNIFWKEWWNTNLKGLAKAKDGTGKPVPEDGEVDFNYVIPFNVRLDSLAKGRDGWRWFIEGKKVSQAALEDEFKLERGALNGDTKEIVGDLVYGNKTEPGSKEEDTVVRIERWEKPSKSHPKGRFMVMAAGWVLYDDESPAPEGQIPYFQIPGIIPLLNSQYYESAVKILQPIQKNFNKLGSMIDEYIQNYKPKAMIPRGALIKGEFERYTRSGVDFIIYNPVGAGTPFWQTPPQPPEMLMRRLTFLENEFDAEGSLHKVSQAQLPKYAQRASGKLWEGMKGQDEAVLLPNIEDTNVALEDALKYRLQLVQKHYSVPRMVRSTGKNKQTSVIFLEGTDLRDNNDVKVRAGIEMFSQKAAKQEVVALLVEKGLLTDGRKALELLDVKGFEEYMEEEFIDERQAYRIVEQIKEGKITIKIHPDDNHEVHYTILNNERKKEDFETWPDKAKEELERLLAEHKAYIAIEQKPAAGGEGGVPTAEEAYPEEAAPSGPELLAEMGI